MLRKNLFITGEYYHIYNRGIDKRVIFKSKKDYERFILLLYVANSQEELFRLDNLINQQHKKFSEILILEKGAPLVSIGAWCLMSNHFHVLVRQEVDGGITKFMRKLGVGYAMFFNIKYQRQGSLFGGLFKSKLIGVNDEYMKHLFGYIHLNPLDMHFPDWEVKVQIFGYIHLNPLDMHFPDWEVKVQNPSDDMKKFLQSYPYSSYLDYADAQTDRPECSILNSESFPKYFEDSNSFEDFIKSYFIKTEL